MGIERGRQLSAVLLLPSSMFQRYIDIELGEDKIAKMLVQHEITAVFNTVRQSHFSWAENCDLKIRSSDFETPYIMTPRHHGLVKIPFFNDENKES